MTHRHHEAPRSGSSRHRAGAPQEVLLGGTGLEVVKVEHQYVSEPVLRGVTLSVEAGEQVALMGPSGCGKSTLLLIAAGILSPTSGTVSLRGSRVSDGTAAERSAIRREHIGIVFQFGELVHELTVLDNVALAAELAGARRRDALRAAAQMLERVGLDDLADRTPGEVSGGQAQRCAIARALVHRPRLVIADEPTGALDQRNAALVLDLMLELTRESGASLLMATHDAQVAARCDRTLLMLDGQISS